MMDLIDREALLNYLQCYKKESYCGGFVCFDLIMDEIECEPTVDAVEVVRCWECVHRRKRECPLYNEKYMEYDMGYGDIEQVCKITDGTIDDGFCYKGERRGD
jgi:hypothetical protein